MQYAQSITVNVSWFKQPTTGYACRQTVYHVPLVYTY